MKRIVAKNRCDPSQIAWLDVTKFVPATAELFEKTYLEMLDALYSR